MKLNIRTLTIAAVLAAIYAALTLVLPIPVYGQIQFRVAEALTVLPFFYPPAILGLFVGCLVANLFSPLVLDVIFGSLATLLAGLWTARLHNRWLAPLPPVVCNGVIVGCELALSQVGQTAAFPRAFALNALCVGAGEVLTCYILGSVLLTALYRTDACRQMIPPERLAKLKGF